MRVTVKDPSLVSDELLRKSGAKGVLRTEGKEYVMQDGDVVEFLFNV